MGQNGYLTIIFDRSNTGVKSFMMLVFDQFFSAAAEGWQFDQFDQFGHFDHILTAAPRRRSWYRFDRFDCFDRFDRFDHMPRPGPRRGGTAGGRGGISLTNLPLFLTA